MTDEPQVPDLEVHDNIPSGLKVTAELPYRVLIYASFAGSSDEGTLSGPLAEGMIEVNAEKLDEVMATACPSINFTTTDPTAAGNVMAGVALRFESLKAFAPAELTEQIPQTRSMMRVREKVVERLLGKIDSATLSSAVAAAAGADASLAWVQELLKWSPAASAPPADSQDVNALLGSLDLGVEQNEQPTDGPPLPKSDIARMVSAAAADSTSIPGGESSALRHTLAEIDKKISAWLTTVLHAPQVQSIEAVWRSLAYLVANTEFRKGVRIYLLHASPADRLENFRSRLIDPVFDEGVPAPDLILADGQFSNTAADMETLDELAQHGASLPAVVLAGVSSGFFGVKHAWQMNTLPTIPNMFDQWQFAKWKGIRNEHYARSMGAVFGRCMLRSPYAHDDAKDLEFAYREETVGERDFLWASGAFAVAVTTIRSVTETGWPTKMSGFVHGRLEGFKSGKGGKKGDKDFGPTDTQLPQPKIEEMAAIGLNAAVGIRDHSDAVVWNGLTAARPVQLDPNGLLEVSLPYQLFASRLSVLLFELKPHLSGLGGEQVKKTVRQHVCQWLGITEEPTEEDLNVLTRPAEDDPSTIEMAVTIKPPMEILPAEIPVVMGYRLTEHEE